MTYRPRTGLEDKIPDMVATETSSSDLSAIHLLKCSQLAASSLLTSGIPSSVSAKAPLPPRGPCSMTRHRAGLRA